MYESLFAMNFCDEYVAEVGKADNLVNVFSCQTLAQECCLSVLVLFHMRSDTCFSVFLILYCCFLNLILVSVQVIEAKSDLYQIGFDVDIIQKMVSGLVG